MEKIKVGTQETLYDIKSIRPISANILQIIFTSTVPATWGDITVYTCGGFEADTLSGYETLYRDEGKIVYLSNDGSIYTALETSDGPSMPPEPYEPTLEELQAAKRREVSAACRQCIYAGVSVALSDGTTEHYSLTEHDQLNLFERQSRLAAGITQLEYHADGQACRYYSVTDMQEIIRGAMWHISYHTTYCNALNMWATCCQTPEEVRKIFYGSDVPEQYQSDALQAYLKQIATMAGGVDSDA